MPHSPHTSRSPIIGVPLDAEDGGGYSELPWYALRKNYAESIVAYGGVPVFLPHHPGLVEHYLPLLDGLLVPGGFFDIDPSMFGATTRHDTVVTKPSRTEFELGIVRAVLAKNLPVLGICAGEQLLNVMHGGTLIQHIPDSFANALEHEQKNPRTETSHRVNVIKDTLLHRITGVDHFEVNSSHHQAVDKPGKGVIINCHAPDGVVEGIELPEYRFCLGVEWHPEYLITEVDHAVMRAFVDACRA